MTTVVIAARVAQDFARIVEHLAQHEATDAQGRVEDIIAALDVLAHNPRIGRPVDDVLRELVIGRDRHGYLALYAYDAPTDEAVILAIRSQKESGYHSP